MIRGVHAMFYTSAAAETRDFIRDKLGLKWADVGGGWLLFRAEGEVGCHPDDPAHGAPAGMHSISFYCDDITKTVAELKSRGVEFTADIADHGYGFVTFMKTPGDFQVQLYQPKYAKK